MNSALVNLLTFWKLPYSISSGSETDFVLLIARQIFKQHCNTPELEKHCKKYQQKGFLTWWFVLLVINLLKSLIKT